MTENSNDRRSGPFNGDGSTTMFSYDFKINQDSDLDVFIKSSGGTVTQQVLTTDYSVSGVGQGMGGNVTFVNAPKADDKVLILGGSTFNQPTDLTTGDVLFSASLQESIDRVVRLVQQVEEKTRRALLAESFSSLTDITVTDPVSGDVGKQLTLDSLSSPAATFKFTEAISNQVTITSFMETLLDDADADAAQQTLGLSKIVLPDDIPSASVSNTGTSNVAFTNVSISGQTGSDTALAVWLRVSVRVVSDGSSNVQTITVDLRKAGTTPTNPRRVKATHQGPIVSLGQTLEVHRSVLVPLDGSEAYEYSITYENGGSMQEALVEIQTEAYVT